MWRIISEIWRSTASHWRNMVGFDGKMRNSTESGEKWWNLARSGDILVKSGEIWRTMAKFGGLLTKFGEMWRVRVWLEALYTLRRPSLIPRKFYFTFILLILFILARTSLLIRNRRSHCYTLDLVTFSTVSRIIRIPRQRRILLKTAPELSISNNLVPSREHVLLVLRLFSNESLAIEKHGSHKELWF